MLNKKTFFYYIFILFTACTNMSEEEQSLVGNWDAVWMASSPEALEGVPENIKTSMDGEIIFEADFTAQISGYGFPGCLFAQDTIRNRLSWRLEDQSIQLFNETDSFSMEYKILFLDADSASFNFLEDFNILLKKR